jgi:hypothetical protein
MNQRGSLSRPARLEQLEPRELLNGLPLTLSQEPSWNTGYWFWPGAIASYASNYLTSGQPVYSNLGNQHTDIHPGSDAALLVRALSSSEYIPKAASTVLPGPVSASLKASFPSQGSASLGGLPFAGPGFPVKPRAFTPLELKSRLAALDDLHAMLKLTAASRLDLPAPGSDVQWPASLVDSGLAPAASLDQPFPAENSTPFLQRLETIFLKAQGLLAQLAHFGAPPDSGFGDVPPSLPLGPGLFSPGLFFFAGLRAFLASQSNLGEIVAAAGIGQATLEPGLVSPGVANSGTAAPASSQTTGPSASGKPATETATTFSSAWSTLTRVALCRFDSSSPGPNPEPPIPPGNYESPSGGSMLGGPASPELRHVPVEPASPSEHSALGLAGVLGDHSVLAAALLERGIAEFLDKVNATQQLASGEDVDGGLAPWITAMAIAALACESGRRQILRSRSRYRRDDARDEIRDALFLNLDHFHE